jgi:predicted transcriptional regulator
MIRADKKNLEASTIMARPRAKELTQRELDVMRVFWERGESSVADERDALEKRGCGLAYTTVATLVKILHEKGFLEQTNDERPYFYQPCRSQEEVSRSLLGDLVQQLFGGSRELLLMRLFEDSKLTTEERTALQQILREKRR